MTQYNQNATGLGSSIKIGNWLEEQKLDNETGVRFYPSPKDRKNSLLTKARCITHTDQVLAKDYKSVVHDTYIDPRTHPEYIQSNNKSKVITRSMLLEQKLKSEVEQEFAQTQENEFNEARKTDFLSTSQRSYNVSGFKAKLNEDIPEDIPQSSSVYEAPITFYSHAYQKGNKLSFPVTPVVTTNPFKKNSVFSADIERDILRIKHEDLEPGNEFS